MSTVDLKKAERHLYTAGGEPMLVDVPPMGYLMVDGVGDPNSVPAYHEAIETLYPVAYQVRKQLKEASGTAYVVAPLEGLWWSDDMAAFTSGDRSSWRWTMMIRLPDPVSAEMAAAAIGEVNARKHPPAGDRIRFERLAEGQAAQIMHRGPYAEEGPTIERLHTFVADHGLALSGRHHEIYLSDPRKTAPERMRTVIRQPVREC